MFQAQAVLLKLEEFFVQRKNLRRASAARRRKPSLGVRENFFQMSGGSHRNFGGVAQFKVEKPKAKIPARFA
jgi:hypothetical protein